MKYSIGIDLGGTYTKSGIVDENGKILSSTSFLTPNSGNEIVKSIAQNSVMLAKQSLIAWESIASIGIGCAGPVRSGDTIIQSLTNLPIKNFDLPSLLLRGFSDMGTLFCGPITLINDADAAALAEHRLGAGVGFSHMALLTVGTGVGCGIVLDGKIYQGAGAAGEIGHTIIAAGGRRCIGCGKRGCLETYASITALTKTADRLRKKHKQSLLNSHDILDGKTVFDCYFAGDEAATLAVLQLIDYLSIGMVNLANIISPEVIVIGGGVSKLGDRFVQLIEAQCAKLSSLSNMPFPKVKHAQLYNDAGIIGAALASQVGTNLPRL